MDTDPRCKLMSCYQLICISGMCCLPLCINATRTILAVNEEDRKILLRRSGNQATTYNHTYLRSPLDQIYNYACIVQCAPSCQDSLLFLMRFFGVRIFRVLTHQK